MSQNSQTPQNDFAGALGATKVPNLCSLAGNDLINTEKVLGTAALQSQVRLPTILFPRLHSDLTNLQAQLDLPRLRIADQVMDRLGAQTAEFSRHLMRQITLPAAEVAEQIMRTIVPSAQLMAGLQAQLDAVAKQAAQSLWRTLEPLRELAERAGRSQAVCDAFVAYGLWLAPSMSDDLVQKIVTFHEQGARPGVVHSVVSRYYARANWRTLDGVVERCRGNHRLAHRAEAVNQALHAHRDSLYAVTVPALLAHVEGIAADYVKSNNLLPKVGKETKKIIVAALDGTPCSLLDVRTYAAVTALLDYIENSMYVYVDFDKEHRHLLGEKRLMAHAIRHGRQVSYGSRMNSLRLFLMVDVLSLLN